MSKRKASFDLIAERETGLKRSLSSAQLSMIAIGGAIGTGLFLGSSFAISFAGPSVLISYTIGALIALMLMGCLAEMTVHHPVSGSFGSFAEYYLAPCLGFIVRYAYWYAVVFAVGTEVTAVAIYMKFWYPDIPGWIWMITFSAALVFVNAYSTKAFGQIEYSLSLIKVLAILLFIILGIYVVFVSSGDSSIGLHHYTAHGGFFPHGLSGTWIAVVVAIFSYLSIEMIAIAAGETQNPKQSIISAFRITVVRLVLFYLVTLALILAIVPWNESGQGDSPFVRVMSATHIPGAAAIFNAIILIAALSAMNSQLFTTTRMMFTLARARQAPAIFGKLSSNAIPLPALLLSTLGVALATVIYLFYPENAFTLMVSISMFGAMFTWAMIFLTHLFFRRRHAGEKLLFRAWGAPYTSAIGLLLMLAIMLTTIFTEMFRLTLICGIPFILLLLVGYYSYFREAVVAETTFTTEYKSSSNY